MSSSLCNVTHLDDVVGVPLCPSPAAQVGLRELPGVGARARLAGQQEEVRVPPVRDVEQLVRVELLVVPVKGDAGHVLSRLRVGQDLERKERKEFDG